jgi:hypothetical protein
MARAKKVKEVKHEAEPTKQEEKAAAPKEPEPKKDMIAVYQHERDPIYKARFAMWAEREDRLAQKFQHALDKLIEIINKECPDAPQKFGYDDMAGFLEEAFSADSKGYKFAKLRSGEGAPELGAVLDGEKVTIGILRNKDDKKDKKVWAKTKDAEHLRNDLEPVKRWLLVRFWLFG